MGATLARRQVAGLTLAETRYVPGTVIGAHAHSTPLVATVTEGAMTEEKERRKVLCGAGTLIYQPPDEAHGHRFGETGGSCFILQFGEEWTRRMGELEVLRPDAPLDLRRSRSNWVLERIREEARTRDEASGLTIEGLSVMLLGELRRAGSRTREGVRPGWLIRALEILHDSPEAAPSLGELAARVGVHPEHLSRTFTRFQGCSMGEYLRRLRVERAARALRETDHPIARIALDAGFADQAHFTRTFKGIMGETPGRYRASR
jgi:AraC family transcriptional regulator